MFHDELYIGCGMDISLYFKRAGGTITGFCWIYNKEERARVFTKTGDKISHRFLLPEENEMLVCSRLEQRHIAEPGRIEEKHISSLLAQSGVIRKKYLFYVLKYISIYNKCLVNPE